MPIDYTRRGPKSGQSVAMSEQPGPAPVPAPSQWLDVVHGAPQVTVDRVRALVEGPLGLRTQSLDPGPLGVGFGVGFGDTDFVVVSAAGGNDQHVSLTCGVLRDVRRERLLVLDACNRITQNRAAYPVFLHDAEIGWDVLLQTSFPLQVVLDAPGYAKAMLVGLPEVAAEARGQLLAGGVGGVGYRWEPADLQRLLVRSMM